MPLTPQDVRSKQFTQTGLGRKGYDEHEVRAFLEEVATELEGVLAARTEAVERLEATQKALITAQQRPEPAPAPAPEPAPPAEDVAVRAARVLALAERTADEHVGQARSEAEQLVSTARERAETMDREADERRRQVIGAIEAQRAELEQRIESLRSFEREYRSRLTAYLQQQLAELHAGGSSDATTAAPGPVDGQRAAGA
ncbi:DivIVA domain-containing protein [Vallicoccus soli]|uniref:Cell wall synthesis protein Wag31 n=1 Tax=Vallicoccus soli TaxID=2339232 RepID=A0A3A3Z253_9ACTN|nr:DivIVA domain-containing protein [Vallicoccus soli]RJK96814.1 DivIVA domain-containing protein [Vallicoccus soli]